MMFGSSSMSVVETIGAPALGEVRRAGRRSVKRLAQAMMPPSVIVWRGPARPPETSPHGGSPVALTFDDGPDAMTSDYLAVLSDLGVRATFFLVGSRCAEHPGMVAEIRDAGHELAIHGYTHRRFTTLAPKEIEDELGRTRELLPASRRALVRPPHGAVSFRSLFACVRGGFTTVMWSHDSGDARTESSDDVVHAFERGVVEPGDISLLHEGQPWTLHALPRIVARLKDEGHAPVTVGELLHG
jgi:peptidoglycan/xylan/chitin deacetylase (PgdA/CDA1 family)